MSYMLWAISVICPYEEDALSMREHVETFVASNNSLASISKP